MVDRSSPAWLSCAPLKNASGSLRPNSPAPADSAHAVLVLGFMSRPSLSPSRVAIALLCAGALAFACGPRTHSEAASTASLATAAPVIQQGMPHTRNDGAPLASNLDVKLEREGVRFALVLTNRSEEHTSELQSQFHLVCRLLLEKKKGLHDLRLRLPHVLHAHAYRQDAH